MLTLVCGQFLVWRRRDNVLAYVQGGMFLSTFAVPLFGTDITNNYERHVLETYVVVLLLGALAFLLGLAYGAYVGGRSAGRVPLTFAHPISGGERNALVWSRARWLAVAAGVSLLAAYALLGYIPLLAADGRSAKYGIGPYAGGFARARIVYLFGLTSAAAVLPVILALFYRHRRMFDLALAIGLEIGLVCSLSRALAFIGPLIFIVALAVERRVRGPLILAGVMAASVGGIVFNQLTFPNATDRPSFASLAAASAPDLADHLNFLRGYEMSGRPENHGRTILAGLDPRGGEDGSTYALRTATGINDVSLLAAGGLRLPAPVWGFSAFGLWGTVLWSFASGMFAGWGAAKFKRLLRSSMGLEGQALNLVLGVLVYNGTFGLLEQFYFTSTAGFVLLGTAVVVGVYVRFPILLRSRSTTGEMTHDMMARTNAGAYAGRAAEGSSIGR